MSLEATLAAGRRAAERDMQSRCKITRTTPISLDTVTLNLRDLDPTDDNVYEGPCRVKSLTGRVFAVLGEGQTLAEQQLIVSLPIDATADVSYGTSGSVRIGDRVEVVEGGPDAALTGTVLRIAGEPEQTLATARRFPVEHVA